MDVREKSSNEKRLIDANALLEKLKKTSRYFTVKFDIEEAPTVDAVEVVHGRWIEKDKYTFGVMYDCSICDNRILDTGHSWNYCPNCGAKMDL